MNIWLVKIQFLSQALLSKQNFSEKDKKEGILKRLENIKDKNDELLKTINKTNESPKNKKKHSE